MIRLQMETQAEMKAEMQEMKGHQEGTKEVITAVVAAVNKNRKQIAAFKKETNDMMRMLRKLLALLYKAMAKS